MRGLFVTGTDTGVGKTVTCAALLHRYRGLASLRYWKPVQTGIEQDDDTATVRLLAAAGDAEIFAQGVRLEKPVSPHLAAKWAGQPIDLQRLRLQLQAAGNGADTRWIVEGAGGALVPLNEASTVLDFMVMLSLPVVIAARSGLGTINHSLLTIEALRARSLAVTGVVLVGELNPDNAAAIEHYGCVPVLAQMPPVNPLTPESLAAWSAAQFDPRGLLGEILP